MQSGAGTTADRVEIFLVGFMGAGKTTAGRLLAEVEGRPFVDLDDEIERATGKRIREIFEGSGEEAFRALEHARLRETAHTAAVVATGGGTIAFEGNRRWMRRHGLTVWIRPTFDAIVRRIGVRGKENRPLFRSMEEARELYASRLPYYGTANLTLDVGSDETPEEVAARLRLLIRD